MDDVCAACRTQAGVGRQCQHCGFDFCETHAAPTDHKCPAIGDGPGTSDDDDSGTTPGSDGPIAAVAAAGATAVAAVGSAAASARTAISRRSGALAGSLGEAGSTLRSRVGSRGTPHGGHQRDEPDATDGSALRRAIERTRSAVGRAVPRVRTAVGAAVERVRTIVGGTARGNERSTGRSLAGVRRRLGTAAEQTRARVGRALGGGRGTDRLRKQFASAGIVVVLLVATSAILLGTSGVAIDGLGGGESGSTVAPTNEMPTNGSTAAEPIEGSESIDDALFAEINDTRSEEGIAELDADGELERIATNHSEDMAEAESADLDAWDSDRLADRLNATDGSCESIAQTGAWIDPGDETDANALANATVDRWLEDDEFRQFLLASDHELGAVASAGGTDGRRYVSVTVCGP